VCLWWWWSRAEKMNACQAHSMCRSLWLRVSSVACFALHGLPVTGPADLQGAASANTPRFQIQSHPAIWDQSCIVRRWEGTGA
jgi:hypothetical protein